MPKFKLFGSDGKIEESRPITVADIKEACAEQYAAIRAEGIAEGEAKAKAEAQKIVDVLKAETANKETLAVTAERARISGILELGKAAGLELKALEFAMAGKSKDETMTGLLAETKNQIAKAQGLLKFREDTTAPMGQELPEDVRALSSMTKEEARLALGKKWDSDPKYREGYISKNGYVSDMIHQIFEKN